MFDILFGWRKASKCKKVIRRAQCRLKLLKNKRSSIVRQLREDVTQLIKNGHEDVAIERAEQLFKDESIMAVYDLLDQFCEFVIANLSYIRRNRDCPNDINEAVSSLIFASARCGDLPELRVIRKLFGERYGNRFAATAVELFPGNLVNSQIRDNLSIKSVPYDAKHRLVDKIARECCLKPEILAIEFSSERQRQMKENMEQKLMDKKFTISHVDEESQVQVSSAKEIGTEAIIHVDSVATAHELQVTPSQSHPKLHQDTADTFVRSSIVSWPSNNLSDPSLSPSNLLLTGPDGIKSTTAIQEASEPKEDIMGTSSSSSNSPQFSEGKVVYLDDVEELQSLPKVDENGQDRRLFKFKTSLSLQKDTPEVKLDQGYIEEYESSDEKKSTSRSSTKNEAPSGKRLRRRSLSRDNQSIEDCEFMVYYDKPGKNSTHKLSCGRQGKHPKMSHAEENDQFFSLRQKTGQRSGPDSGSHSSSCRLEYVTVKSHRDPCSNCKINKCSSENPCYHCSGDQSRLMGLQTRHYKEETLIEGFCNCPGHRNEKLDVNSSSMPLRQKGSSFEGGSAVYNVFTYRNYKLNKKSMNKESMAEGSDSSGSDTFFVIDNFEDEVLSPYVRAMTMPPEWRKDEFKEKVPRSNSFPIQCPTHVHPKLPDYDDLTAKFAALKQEHLQTTRPRGQKQEAK
ncbi:hypothetical protein NL676_000847 [Syzygium grande]|nr:hypothetical protein NL676_000847 [Syzygium grande]